MNSVPQQITCKKNYPKAYIRVLKGLTNQQIIKDVHTAIAPRGGWESNKAADFDYFIEKATGHMNDMGQFTRMIVEGSSQLNKKWGKTAKERLINILNTLTR